MHEVSLIQALLEMVARSAAENGITRVTAVKLVVGESHGALPDALEFAFRVLTEDTVCAGAALVIEKRPVLLQCRACGEKFGPRGFSFTCPFCGAGGAALLGGRELYVEYYEGE